MMGNTVVNTIEVESLSFMPGLLDASLGGKVGDTWDGSTFTSPQPVTKIPDAITSRQGLKILSRNGLLTTVQAALQNMPGQAGADARIDFDHAVDWHRHWPLLVSLAQQLGLSDAQIDQMFIDASGL